MVLNLEEDGIDVYKALASETRVKILSILASKPATASDLAKELSLTKAIVSRHLKELENANLIHQSHNYKSEDDRKKVYTLKVDQIQINFPHRIYMPFKKKTSEIPLGLYSNFDIQPTCGLASQSATIGQFDDPRSFVANQRVDASLLWFSRGFVEYRIPNMLNENEKPELLELSMELSSEFPESSNRWPSDITFSINGIELATWTSPGNYSDVRGKYTPDWWDSSFSQYGDLIYLRCSHLNTNVDAVKMSDVTIDDLHLNDSPWITLRIAVKPDAKNPGGVTLFGKSFGNSPQDIIFNLYHSDTTE
ncbi:MAG: ArsR family transcriptional regulator [Pseudobutyrivibrio sp.]|nr:ArsR family transcriptional regulator [Pseudobutyrivibrio sp.]